MDVKMVLLIVALRRILLVEKQFCPCLLSFTAANLRIPGKQKDVSGDSSASLVANPGTQ